MIWEEIDLQNVALSASAEKHVVVTINVTTLTLRNKLLMLAEFIRDGETAWALTHSLAGNI